MKTLDICPQRIFEFTADETLRQEIQQIVAGELYEANSATQVSIHKNLEKKPEYKKAIKWFESCVEEVRKYYEYKCDKLPITQMWANKANNDNWHEAHYHPFSIISGIFYVNDSSAKTWFSIDDFWVKKWTNYPLTLVENFTKCPYVIHQQPSIGGTLLLFPSHLMHSVSEHKGENPRYTIAFNTFPAGIVGNVHGLASVKIPI